MEDFIQRCIKMGDWSLGYGLLYDQYDKVSKELRRGLMVEAIKDGSIISENKSMKVGTRALSLNQPAKDFFGGALPFFQNAEVRGLIKNDTYDLLKKAILYNDLTIDDLQSIDKDHFHFILISCYSSNLDISIHTKVIEILRKTRNHRILIYGYQYYLLKCIRNNEDISILIQFFDTKYPDYGKNWKILYLVHSYEGHFSYKRHYSYFINQYIVFPVGSVPEQWLISTKKWEELGGQTIDLLSSFKIHLHKLHKDNIISPELYKKAMEDTEALIKRREKLEIPEKKNSTT